MMTRSTHIPPKEPVDRRTTEAIRQPTGTIHLQDARHAGKGYDSAAGFRPLLVRDTCRMAPPRPMRRRGNAHRRGRSALAQADGDGLTLLSPSFSVAVFVAREVRASPNLARWFMSRRLHIHRSALARLLDFVRRWQRRNGHRRRCDLRQRSIGILHQRPTIGLQTTRSFGF